MSQHKPHRMPKGNAKHFSNAKNKRTSNPEFYIQQKYPSGTKGNNQVILRREKI